MGEIVAQHSFSRRWHCRFSLCLIGIYGQTNDNVMKSKLGPNINFNSPGASTDERERPYCIAGRRLDGISIITLGDNLSERVLSMF